jgi:hypothetical protein
MSGVGKDGNAFDLARWVEWAASGGNSMGLKMKPGIEDAARLRAGRKWTRRGGPRRECECGRMNPTSLLVCKCGRQTERTKAPRK